MFEYSFTCSRISQDLRIYPKHVGPLLSACQRLRSPLFPCHRFLFDRVHGKASLLPPAAEEDGDVQAERNRVESGKADFDVVQLQNLTKIYHLPHKRITAVKNISLGIPAGEVSNRKRLLASSTLGRKTGTHPQSNSHLLTLSLLLSQNNYNGLFCSDLFLLHGF